MEITKKQSGKASRGRVGPTGKYGKYKENTYSRGTFGYGRICELGASAMNLGHCIEIKNGWLRSNHKISHRQGKGSGHQKRDHQ